MYKKFFGWAIILTVGVLTLSSCSGQSSSGNGKSVQLDSTVEFTWPEGYTYDGETNLLLAPSGKKDNYLPSYLTSVNIKIVASDGTVWYDHTFAPPTNNMSINVVLDPGTYTFFGIATTTTTETYTAEQTHTFSAGDSINVTFNFQLNAIPTIKVTGPSSVNKGESANIKVTATDEDDGDTLTISKSANGGSLSRSLAKETLLSSVISYLAQVVINPVWTAPNNKGTYKLTFTVTDGHGGIATDAINIESVNSAPTVSITADKSSVDVGQSILFTCVGSDADSSDSGNLSLSFGGVASTSGTGGTITDTYTTVSGDGSSITATCQGTDSDGATASDSVTVSINQSVVINGSIAADQCGGIRDEWTFTSISGKSYTVICSTSTSGGDLYLMRWYFSGGWISDGTTNLTGPDTDETVTWTAPISGNYRFGIKDRGGNAIQYSCTFTGTLPTDITLTGDDVNANGC